jgi:hypothetical protein
MLKIAAQFRTAACGGGVAKVDTRRNVEDEW